MFAVATAGILVAMLLVLRRAYTGPTTYDRILAANMIGTDTVLLIAVTGFLTGRPEWLDIALIYALMSFIGTIAVLRFSKYRSFASDEQLKS